MPRPRLHEPRYGMAASWLECLLGVVRGVVLRLVDKNRARTRNLKIDADAKTHVVRFALEMGPAATQVGNRVGDAVADKRDLMVTGIGPVLAFWSVARMHADLARSGTEDQPLRGIIAAFVADEGKLQHLLEELPRGGRIGGVDEGVLADDHTATIGRGWAARARSREAGYEGPPSHKMYPNNQGLHTACGWCQEPEPSSFPGRCQPEGSERGRVDRLADCFSRWAGLGDCLGSLLQFAVVQLRVAQNFPGSPSGEEQ